MNDPIHLNQYRRSLLAKQRELLAGNGGKLAREAAEGMAAADTLDQAVAETEARIDYRVSQARSSMRRAVELALVRLNTGNYGICTDCGNPISPARLQAVPWTEYCRDCMEQKGV